MKELRGAPSVRELPDTVAHVVHVDHDNVRAPLRGRPGATPAAAAALVARDGLTMLVAGIAVGLPASWWLARFVESRLYGVARLDPVSLAAGGAGVALLAILAGLPAVRRALHTGVASLTR